MIERDTVVPANRSLAKEGRAISLTTIEKLAIEMDVPLTYVATLLVNLERDHGREKILTKAGSLTKFATAEIRYHLLASLESQEALKKYILEMKSMNGDAGKEIRQKRKGNNGQS